MEIPDSTQRPQYTLIARAKAPMTLENRVDPWGRLYVSRRGARRLRHSLRCQQRLHERLESRLLAPMAATVLSVFQDLDATVMVLPWNFGVAAAIVGLGYSFGRRASALV
jgi:hypothetical protein